MGNRNWEREVGIGTEKGKGNKNWEREWGIGTGKSKEKLELGTGRRNRNCGKGETENGEEGRKKRKKREGGGESELTGD
jgi:hypothetical protein